MSHYIIFQHSTLTYIWVQQIIFGYSRFPGILKDLQPQPGNEDVTHSEEDHGRNVDNLTFIALAMFENNDLSYYHQLVKDLRRSSFR